MSNEIIFYDLSSKPPCRSWSGNTLKTRTILNYKSIPYTTKWTPFHKLHSTLSQTGIPPNPAGSWAEYTLPFVILPDGTKLMDSVVIAQELEKRYPSPSLHLDLGVHEEAAKAIGGVIAALRPYFFPRVARLLVREDDEEWFYADREKRLGMTLEEYGVSKGTTEEIFEGARSALEDLERVLKQSKRDEGPFVLGSEVKYGDFVILAFVHTFMSFGGEEFEEFVGRVEGLRELYEAGGKWCAS